MEKKAGMTFLTTLPWPTGATIQLVKHENKNKKNPNLLHIFGMFSLGEGGGRDGKRGNKVRPIIQFFFYSCLYLYRVEASPRFTQPIHVSL
jgi:hypothetical protein